MLRSIVKQLVTNRRSFAAANNRHEALANERVVSTCSGQLSWRVVNAS